MASLDQTLLFVKNTKEVEFHTNSQNVCMYELMIHFHGSIVLKFLIHFSLMYFCPFAPAPVYTHTTTEQ